MVDHVVAANAFSTSVFTSPEFIWFLLGIIIGFIIAKKLG